MELRNQQDRIRCSFHTFSFPDIIYGYLCRFIHSHRSRKCSFFSTLTIHQKHKTRKLCGAMSKQTLNLCSTKEER